MSIQDLQYYERRARQERERAARADDATAKCVHLELAERYAAILAASDAAPEAAHA